MFLALNKSSARERVISCLVTSLTGLKAYVASPLSSETPPDATAHLSLRRTAGGPSGAAAVLAFLILALAFSSTASFATGCGTERWAVKTLADGFQPSEDSTPFTVAKLLEFKKPMALPIGRLNLEKLFVTVPVSIWGFKLESDSDIHIVVSDPVDPKATLVAEIPSPNCVSVKLGPIFSTARKQLTDLTGHKIPRSAGKMIWFKKPVPVRISGLVFFDKLHGQTGLAPNGVEIHPVFSIFGTSDGVPDTGLQEASNH